MAMDQMMYRRIEKISAMVIIDTLDKVHIPALYKIIDNVRYGVYTSNGWNTNGSAITSYKMKTGKLK